MIIYEEDKASITNIRKHKYSCTDKSILAKYVLQYFWKLILVFVPKWVAPNVLSILGLLSMLISTALTLSMNYTLNIKEKSFLHLSNAICLLIYSTFDAIDGKQAVRTNSSSPLGQMFDHGVDSLVSTLVGITLSSSLGLGAGNDMLFLISGILIIFYLTTFREKMTGNFSLGYINGPTEGIYFGILLHLISFFKGASFFNFLTFPSFFGASNFMAVCSLILIFNFFYFFYDLWKVIGQKSKLVLKNFFFLIGMILSVYKITNSISKENPFYIYVAVFSFMFIFSYMTIELIFSRIKNTEICLPPLSYYFLIFSAVFFDYFCDEVKKFVVLGVFAHCFVFYFIKIFSICYVVSEELDIKIFKISDSKKK